MKAVIQRVTEARVVIDGEVVGKIARGLVVFIGVAKGDSQSDADYLADKLCGLRIFNDSEGRMNLSIAGIQGEFLVVSQFTLLGDCVKGRRPSFDQAAEPPEAQELYEYCVKKLREKNLKVETGKFRAMMDVSLVNDGPVTFILESKKGRE